MDSNERQISDSIDGGILPVASNETPAFNYSTNQSKLMLDHHELHVALNRHFPTFQVHVVIQIRTTSKIVGILH